MDSIVTSDSTIPRLTGALADRYRIERELGAGGMATVYLAHDIKHDRQVAIKVLKPELAAVLGAERFVQEIKTTAALQHPHILPLFDSGAADGFLYYVMPFIDGETLRAKLDRETQLAVDDAVRTAREVADALDYAHTRGIVHRDVKPENIMLYGGHALVVDFGIALAVSAAAGGRMTETGLSLGTPHYMSPEQATAEKEITARSDIYSIGSVLYEMLAGQPPHLGGSAQQIVMKIIADVPRPLPELRKSVPPNVAAAVATSLEKIPADRFATSAEFSRALANSSYRRADSDAPGTTAQGRGHTMRIAALVGAAALAIGAVGARLLWRDEPVPQRAARVMLAFPVGQEPLFADLSVGSTLTQMPDGSGLLYWGAGTTTTGALLSREWDRLAPTRTPLAVEEGCCVAVSPTGDSIAYLTSPHKLVVVPLVGGRPITVADSGMAAMTTVGGGVDWASNGWIYASGTTGLVRVRPQGGAVERVSTLDTTRGDGGHLWPSVLPGARAALLTVDPTQESADLSRRSIGVVDFATKRVDILSQGIRALYSPSGHLIVVKSNGVVWAVPFNVQTRRVTGREIELADTVAVRGVTVGTADISLSSSGTAVYSKGVTQSQVAVWVDRTGATTPVSPDLADQVVQAPTLSPDGRRVVVGMGGADGKVHLWTKTLGGGPKSRFTFDGVTNVRAAWRPGTNAISYSAYRVDLGRMVLVERNADGTGEVRRLTTGDRRSIPHHVWSPDGRWLVFRTDDQEAGNADIMGIRPGIDSVARPLVATPAEELSPAISYDGRWLAYTSNETGPREVYVRPFPETGSGRFQVSTTGGTTPVWGRDGREMFYIDRVGNMVAVPLVSGPTLQVGAAKVLFSASAYALNAFARQFDVTPDGTRFLMSRGVSDGQVHVVVVFNFVEELKRLVARP